MFKKFEKFIEKNNKNIINLDYIISVAGSNNLQKVINFSVEKTLKILRLFK